MDERLKSLFLIFAVAGLFAGGYFLLNWISESRDVFILNSTIDNLIPFKASWIYIYISIYFIIFSPVFVIRDYQFFKKAVMAYIFILAVSFFIFSIFPVKMIRPSIEGEDLASRLIKLLYEIDRPYNCFPSIHVSAIFLSSFMCRKLNRSFGMAMLLLAIFISFSTMFTKQHYFLDVAGGIILGSLAYLLFFRSNTTT